MKYYLTLTCLFLFCLAKAQYVTIPDDDFRNFLRTKYPGCFNASQQLNSTCTAVTTEDSLEFHNINSQPITQNIDLTGIQYFTALQYLNCSNNYIGYTGTLPSGLKHLEFSSTAGSPGDGYLPQLPNGLRHLRCANNYLYSLPAHLPDSLRYLDCSGNSFSSLSALPAKLDTLICREQVSYSPYSHILRILPALPSLLRYLDCSNNGLNALPALPASLTHLNCSSQFININPEATQKTLSTLPALPAGLQHLDCGNNYFSVLPTLPGTLKYLDCSAQYIYINNFPPLPDPYSYTLPSLPALPGTLESLYCNQNNISCLPHLPALLNTLVYDTEKIPCVPNATAAAPDVPVCSPAIDYNRCLPYPVISGIVFTDLNNNGIKDANEFPRRNIKLTLSNGAFTFTDNNGLYSLKADSIGAYSVSVTAPSYYNAVPATTNFNFSRYDTAATASFALRAATTKDSLNIKITPYTNSARPGFGFSYLVSYENAGTTTLSPSISLKFDDTRLNYDSSSNAAVYTISNTLNLSLAGLAPGRNDRFIAYFRIKPTAVNRDTLKASASIIAGAVSNTDSNNTIIRGSYDPNDKQATAQLTPAQVTSGSYIDYMIRFQNTGYDAASFVVIADTLSSNLLPGTFELQNTSHPCSISIKNNVVYFEFSNIELPDSNANELKSHGFVQFRIKPSALVPVNTIIENKAAIYFDYNTPVITNTAFTAIKAPGQVYTFTGNGNWNLAGNWKNNLAPPSSVQSDEMVIIAPAANGKCILNVPVTVLPGAAVIVQQGKQFLVQGNLTVQ